MNAKHASLMAWAMVVAVGVGCSGKIESIPDGNPSSPSSSGTGTGGPGPSSSASGTPSGNGTTPTPTASGTATGTPEDACFVVELGTLCSEAPDRAKDVARSVCEGSNAVLTALSYDFTGFCSARCCQDPTTPYPPPTGTGNPPPPPTGTGYPPPPPTGTGTVPVPPWPTATGTQPQPPPCVWAAIADPSGCIPSAQIGVQAQSACDAVRGQLRSINVAGVCPGGVSAAKVECCY